jgi:hypothetical protein
MVQATYAFYPRGGGDTETAPAQIPGLAQADRSSRKMCLDYYYYSINRFETVLRTQVGNNEMRDFARLSSFINAVGKRASSVKGLTLLFDNIYTLDASICTRFVSLFAQFFAHGLKRQVLSIRITEDVTGHRQQFRQVIDHLLDLSQQLSVLRCQCHPSRNYGNHAGWWSEFSTCGGSQNNYECKREVETAIRRMMFCDKQKRAFFMHADTRAVVQPTRFLPTVGEL